MPIHATKSDIYESYKMYHPDGTLMCYCNKKRAFWYINRELATWMSEKEFKLKFPPKGYGKSDNKYYTQSLENKCCVCGKEHTLNKHHVFPYVFRSRMPDEYKKSNHHDILAICTDCHEDYEKFANIYKEEIAVKYNTSINQNRDDAKNYNRKIDNAKKLLEKIKNKKLKDKSGNLIKLSKERMKELKEISKRKYEPDSVKPDFWADTIMKNIMLENALYEFVVSWRNHFIQYANPQYLPSYWDVNSTLESSNKD